MPSLDFIIATRADDERCRFAPAAAGAAGATSLVQRNARLSVCDEACGSEKKHAVTLAVIETWRCHGEFSVWRRGWYDVR